MINNLSFGSNQKIPDKYFQDIENVLNKKPEIKYEPKTGNSLERQENKDSFKNTKENNAKDSNSIFLKQFGAMLMTLIAATGIFIGSNGCSKTDDEESSNTGTKLETQETTSTTATTIEREFEFPGTETSGYEENEICKDFEINLTPNQQYSLDMFLSNWEENKSRYENIEKQTGIPAELVAAIHWRESSGNFNCYLHNGAKLGKEIPVYGGTIKFDNWEEAAIDALKNYGGKPSIIENGNFETYYNYAECYNGTGYSKYHNMNSPYVWAGTDKYECGKYVEDGRFDPNAVDKQIGVAVMLDALLS